MADEKLPDISTMFANPDFRQLSSIEKINFLNRYPDFEGLPLKEKASFIQQGLEKIHMATPGFWRTIGGELSGMAAEAGHRFRHPIDTLTESASFRKREAQETMRAGGEGKLGEAARHYGRAILGPTGTAIAHSQLEQIRQANREAQAGQPLRALGHTAAGVLPIAGPAAAQAGEEFQRGETGAGAAHSLLLLGPDIVSAGLGLGEWAGGAATRRALRSRLSPTQAARLTELEARAKAGGFKGRVTTLGESRGIPTIVKGEHTMQHIPGAAGPAEDFYTERAGELERQARESVKAASPTMPAPPAYTPADVGMEAYSEAGRSVRKMKRAADVVYDDVRARAAQGKVNIPIGVRVEVRPGGAKVYHPIIGTYEAPVPLKPYRTNLRPLYNEFRSAFKDLDESQRMANPGYASLHRIMTDIDPLTGQLRKFMNAMDLESELGAIKEQLRDRRFSNFLFSKSGRVQLRIIGEGEKAVSAALDRAAPGTSARLQQGRALVRTYKSADRLLTSIVGKDPSKIEPMKMYDAMKTAGDRKITQLDRLSKLAPEATQDTGRMVLEGLLQDATKDLGRLKEGTGTALVNGWDALGPKTKQVFYGRQLTQELDTVFHNIKTLMPAEGSPTAWRIPMMSLLMGPALEVLQSLIGGHPVTAAGVAVNTAATMEAANLAARVLFKPGGGTALTGLLRAARTGGPVLREAARAFQARVAVARQEQQEEQERKEAGEAAPAPAAAEAAPAVRYPGQVGSTPARRQVEQQPSPFPETPAPGPVAGWSSGPRGGVAATPPGGTRPAQGGAARTVAAAKPPAGTTWEYWGMKPPPGEAEAPIRRAAARPGTRDFTQTYQEAGRTNRVPPGLVRVVAQMESGENPEALGKSGEVGIMQLMPETARKLGVADRSDPVQSIQGAGQFLGHLMQKYRGEIWKVLAAYNEGETAFDRRQKRSPGIQSLPESTQRYVRKGLGLLRRTQAATN